MLPILLFLAADYDVLIRNARVVDGTGAAPFTADVGVAGGRIVLVGKADAAKTATRVIDARGRVVAPGFIDVHTHAEGGIDANPQAHNFLLNGVTTIVTGNCGSSRPDLAAWFKTLEAGGLGINIASLYGHNTLRSSVMGAGKNAATPEQMAKMQAQLEKAMRDGAVGFSTGLEYVPGMFVAQDEIVTLAKVAAKYQGLYTTHMRDEGAAVLESLDESLAVGKRAGIRVQISHLKQDTPKHWGMAKQMLARIEKARGEGVDVFADQYPYTRSATGLSIRLPQWSLEGGFAGLQKRIADPAQRPKIKAGMIEILDRRGFKGYQHATVASSQVKSFEGKTISVINVEKGRKPTPEDEADTVLDILTTHDPGMVYHVMSDDDVDRIMVDPFVAVASDGGVRTFGEGNPHPRSYGTNAKILAEYVRNRKVLTLEQAVRKMTGLPAQIFRFQDRGVVKAGMVADLVMFDPAKVQDKSTFAKPHQYSEGFDLVMVSGKVAVETSKPTGERNGKVIRRGS